MQQIEIQNRNEIAEKIKTIDDLKKKIENLEIKQEDKRDVIADINSIDLNIYSNKYKDLFSIPQSMPILPTFDDIVKILGREKE